MVLKRLRDGCTKWPNERLAWQNRMILFIQHIHQRNLYGQTGTHRQAIGCRTAETPMDHLTATKTCLSVSQTTSVEVCSSQVSQSQEPPENPALSKTHICVVPDRLLSSACCTVSCSQTSEILHPALQQHQQTADLSTEEAHLFHTRMNYSADFFQRCQQPTGKAVIQFLSSALAVRRF